MLRCREISEKEKWEDFLLNCRERTFLQSWNWGDFQKKMGNEVLRLGLFEEDDLKAVALVSKIKARRGKFYLIQHGPAIAEGSDTKKLLSFFLEELKKMGDREGFDFIRMNPLLMRTDESKKILEQLGLKESPMHANAYESTWKLDITPSEDNLLADMRKTTRYLIRQCLKNKDITIERRDDAEAALEYQKLNEEVAGRQGFVPFSGEYVKNEFESFIKDGQALFLFGKHRGETAAAALVVYWSGIGFYHQAASRSKYQKFSVPYLLQWEAIKEAKKRGCSLYDFWGYVNPKENPSHPWAGPTLFKMGFGGRAHEYAKTRDYPLSWKYWLVNAFERLRKIKRGL